MTSNEFKLSVTNQVCLSSLPCYKGCDGSRESRCTNKFIPMFQRFLGITGTSHKTNPGDSYVVRNLIRN